MWPEPGSGPWLVWEDDSELKKSFFPSVSGGPLRKHSPPGTASEHPLHSFTKSFKEQMPIRTFYSQPQFWCKSIFSRTFQKVFWRDIILRASFIYNQRNPIPQLWTKSSFLNRLWCQVALEPQPLPTTKKKKIVIWGTTAHPLMYPDEEHGPNPAHWSILGLFQINTSQPNRHISRQIICSGWRDRDLPSNWRQSPVVSDCLCRSSHQFPHFLSVVLNIYPENQQHFSLLTSLKRQKSTQDSSQNTNISRRAFDITDPGRNYYMFIFATQIKRAFKIMRHL